MRKHRFMLTLLCVMTVAACLLLGCAPAAAPAAPAAPAASAAPAAPAASAAPAAPAASTAPAAPADDYPNKPIRLIMGVGSGGAVDVICRRWQAYAEAELGVPLQFEYAEGGGGTIARNITKATEPDGYLFQVDAQSNFCIGPLLLEADYAIEDFDFLNRFTNDPGVIIVHKDAPYNTLGELIAYAKTQPENTVTLSLATITDVNFLGLKQIEQAAGVTFNIVGYTSGGQARLAVVSGEVVGSHANYFGAQAVWADTKVITLHQAVNDQVPALKDVQTVNNALGATLEDISTRYMITLPAGFIAQYPERAKKLEDALNAAWTNPEFLEKLKADGLEGYIDVISREETAAEVQQQWDFFNQYKDLFELG